MIALFSFFKILGIQIRKAKFEDPSRIQVINNSYLDTFKKFVEKADYDYLTGKLIFFNTWASWCGPCVREIPILNKLQLLHNDNEKVVFVSYCNDLQPNLIPEFLKKNKLELNYRFLTSAEGLRLSLRTILSRNPNLHEIDPLIDRVPYNFLIDQNEEVLYFKLGSLTEDDVSTITSILNGLRLLTSLEQKNNQRTQVNL